MALLETDPEIDARLTSEELHQLTDTSFYTRYIDTAFIRLGLIAPPAPDESNMSSSSSDA